MIDCDCRRQGDVVDLRVKGTFWHIISKVKRSINEHKKDISTYTFVFGESCRYKRLGTVNGHWYPGNPTYLNGTYPSDFPCSC
jgi:hypothetical protein